MFEMWFRTVFGLSTKRRAISALFSPWAMSSSTSRSRSVSSGNGAAAPDGPLLHDVSIRSAMPDPKMASPRCTAYGVALAALGGVPAARS